MNKSIRLRFAPSPTGMMHLGNVRTALMNALFAKKKDGLFILRIEDTDATRNYDPQAKHIIDDLHWLGLFYDEGPGKVGSSLPYFQSQRTAFYQDALTYLIENKFVYRCFCSAEQLEKQRTRQIALKKPPRYERTCLVLTQAQIDDHLLAGTPYIWRYQLDQSKQVTINDLAHGNITFDLKNFSDFPLSRSDGSFTFIFANFVDDMLMKITHVIRGEDHLTNTACQAVLFETFKAPLPHFWHLPILCNIEGKKLSKRDFGFSLQDLKRMGFLPEAILNYLAIIGGGSFKQEIMSLDQLVQAIDFDNINTTGQVKFDPEKFRWINNKWISLISPDELYHRCLPYLTQTFSQISSMNSQQVSTMLQILKTNLFTLPDCVTALRFYFERPQLTAQNITSSFEHAHILKTIVGQVIANAHDSTSSINMIKTAAQEQNIKLKDMFGFMRMGLTGTKEGPSLHELLDMLGMQESKDRLQSLLDTI